MVTESVDELQANLKRFDTIDYAVFGIMLTVCSVVGLYFGYKDHTKHKTKKAKQGSETLDYLLGGKNVQAFPVAMSLVATAISGISLLGNGTEIYIYGMQFAYINIAGPVLMGIFNHYVIVPVFYELKIISMYEYLQRRFDMRMRLFGSIVSSFSTIMWLPIVIYVPALAFNQTTGIDIHIITPIIISICVFYTCLGGIKAVIWTDVIQILIMYGVMILIIIKGTLNVGGLGVVIERNWQSGRIEAPDFRIDPTLRHTFWTLTIGGGGFYIITSLNQHVVQRYLTLKDMRSARAASAINVIAGTTLTTLCMFVGLIIYATFHDCDPLTTKLAKAKDQLVPLLVMQTLKDIPGLPGLFIAGVFSAALSSLSSGLNSMSALVLEDYFKPFMKNGVSERASAIIMRGTVVFVGVLSVALVYVVQHLGAVLQLSMSVPTTCTGSLFGVFTIGMFFPQIGRKASFYGAMVGCTVMIYIVLRAQLDMANGLIHHETKMTSTEGCSYNFTTPTVFKVAPIAREREFHHISYLYYMPLGTIITCISAFLLSFIFGFEDPKNVDPSLLAPCVRKKFKSDEIIEIEMPKNIANVIEDK